MVCDKREGILIARLLRKLLITNGITAAVLSGSTSVGAQTVDSSYTLLPSNGEIAAPTGRFDLNLSEDGGGLAAGIFAPLRQTENGYILYDLGLLANIDDNQKVDGLFAHAGLAYRFRSGENQTFGINGYIENGRADGTSEMLTSFSLGGEYDLRFSEQNSFVQAGANAYFALDDYTDTTAFGSLSSAPRDGFDVYGTYGQDHDGYGLSGTLTGFQYFETDFASELTGARADIGMTYWAGLPEGMSIDGSLGVRTDNRANSDAQLVAGLGVNWTFGGGNGTVNSTADCAVVRNDDGTSTVDCGESVIRNPTGSITTKDGQLLNDNVAPPPVQRVGLTAPRRNMAFGTPFTPIEYRPIEEETPVSGGQLTVIVECALNFCDIDDTWNLPITVSGPTSFSTTEALQPPRGPNGVIPNATQRVSTSSAVLAGTYNVSIPEFSPDGQTGFWRVDCGGSEVGSFSVVGGLVDIDVLVDAGDDVTCFFELISS